PLIDVRDVSFSYGEDGFQLKNIHMQIKPYEQIAIVGKSGAGKTTLLHIIAGLIPFSEGDIYINDRQRSKIKEKDWFDQLSYISQDPYLFSGTVAENIAIGANMDVSRTEIMKAAQQARIEELIDSFDTGCACLIDGGG